MESGHHALDGPQAAVGSAAFRPAVPFRISMIGDSNFSALTELPGDSGFGGLHRRRWRGDRMIDGILAIIYVAGCACLVWAGAALG